MRAVEMCKPGNFYTLETLLGGGSEPRECPGRTWMQGTQNQSDHMSTAPSAEGPRAMPLALLKE